MQLFLFQSRVHFFIFGVFCCDFVFILFVYMRPFSLVCIRRKVYVTLVGSKLKAFSCCFQKCLIAAFKVHVVE